jgi:hypothetical protein
MHGRRRDAQERAAWSKARIRRLDCGDRIVDAIAHGPVLRADTDDGERRFDRHRRSSSGRGRAPAAIVSVGLSMSTTERLSEPYRLPTCRAAASTPSVLVGQSLVGDALGRWGAFGHFLRSSRVRPAGRLSRATRWTGPNSAGGREPARIRSSDGQHRHLLNRVVGVVQSRMRA